MFRQGLRRLASREQSVAETSDGIEEARIAKPGVAWRLASAAGLVAARRVQRARRQEGWVVLYRRVDDEELTTPPTSLAGLRVLPSGADRFYADPFPVTVNGRDYIFFEDYRKARKQAVISCVEVDGRGDSSQPEVILERATHLSYPFVFLHGEEVCMVCESRAERKVELLVAREFPNGWERAGPLLEDIDAVDPTIIEVDGTFWLFVTLADPGGWATEDLHVYGAGSLSGPWVPHPLNPVVSDARSARPAGTPFLLNGSIVRPAQDCSRRYGGGTLLQRIDKLSLTEYVETAVGRVSLAGHSRTAVHTYSRSQSLEVIDAMLPATSIDRP